MSSSWAPPISRSLAQSHCNLFSHIGHWTWPLQAFIKCKHTTDIYLSSTLHSRMFPTSGCDDIRKGIQITKCSLKHMYCGTSIHPILLRHPCFQKKKKEKKKLPSFLQLWILNVHCVTQTRKKTNSTSTDMELKDVNICMYCKDLLKHIHR